MLQFAEQLDFPCAVVVKIYISNTIYVRGLLDAPVEQDTHSATAQNSVKVTHFKNNVLAATGITGVLTVTAAFIVWSQNHDRIACGRRVLLEFFD